MHFGFNASAIEFNGVLIINHVLKLCGSILMFKNLQRTENVLLFSDKSSQQSTFAMLQFLMTTPGGNWRCYLKRCLVLYSYRCAVCIQGAFCVFSLRLAFGTCAASRLSADAGRYHEDDVDDDNVFTHTYKCPSVVEQTVYANSFFLW